MSSNKKLINKETLNAYRNRFQKMQKYKFTKEGDELFVSKLVAISEQINNMHVKARIGDLEIHNDGPKELGGTNKGPSPMQSLLASLANCLEITAMLYFTFRNLKVNSVKLKVEATLDRRSALEPKKAPFPGFYDINYTWYIDSEENLKKIERILETVEDICPVKGTFKRDHSLSQKIILNKKENEEK